MTNKNLEIRNVTDNKKGMKDFINLVYDLYADEPTWTPPLKILMKEFFDKKKGPFFAHGIVEFFVAYKNGKPVGRVTAQVDHEYNELHKVNQGSFGFFESPNDLEITRALMDTAESWLQAQNCITCVGPMNFCGNDDNMGFLLDGHERINAFMLNWTKKYYPELFYKLGYEKEQTLVSYVLEDIKKVPAIITVHNNKLLKKYGDDLQIRNIDVNNIKEDAKMIFDIYNEAWSDNWGFVPMTDREADNMAKSLKPIMHPRLIILVFKSGELAGCLCGVPDINQILISNRKGKLTPKIIWDLLFRRKKLSKVRLVIMGVKKKFRRLGLDFIMYNKIFSDSLKYTNFNSVEMGWVLESNKMMKAALGKIDADIGNRFIVMSKELDLDHYFSHL